MSKHKKALKDFNQALGNSKTISYVFLGIGLTLFLLNLSTFLAFLPEKYSVTAFDISTFSSIIIIIYATYVISKE